MESQPPAELEYIIDLPFPVSVNAMYRVIRGRPILSKPYREWKRQADVLAFAQHVGGLRMLGSFSAEIILAWDNRRRGDADNLVKCVLDACQRWRVIRNDSDCRSVTARWDGRAHAPEGCRLILRGTRP